MVQLGLLRRLTAVFAVSLCLLFPMTARAGGPLVLMGIDAEDGGVGGHGPVTTYAAVVTSIYSASTNGGSGILVIGGGKSAGDNVTTFWNAIRTLTGFPVTFVNGATGIGTVALSGYRMIAVASDQGNTPSGGLTSAENIALGARKLDVADFVNNGGGLLGFSSSFSAGAGGPYPHVGALGSFTFSVGGNYSNITPTADGLAIGITNSLDVSFWHDEFLTFPSFLTVLATNAASGRAAAIGGVNVVLPGSISLTPSEAFAHTPGPHTVTALVRDTNLNPLGGKTVSFEIISGPNAGLTGSAVSASDGTAPFSYTGTGGEGVDTIKASFTDDTGTLRSITAKMTWDDTAPAIVLTNSGVDGSGKEFFEITVTDPLSGLASLNAISTGNATAAIPAFATGATGPVVVIVTQTDTTLSFSVTLEAIDRASNGANVTFKSNQPPDANAGADRTVDATAILTPVALDGTGSSDPDGDPLTYRWYENGALVATGATPTVALSLGTHTLTLEVTDPDGASDTDTVDITVRVTYDSLCALVDSFSSKPDFAESLCAKLRAAQEAEARGNLNAKANILEAFKHEVEAQRGKAFTNEQADILIYLANAL